MSCLHLVLIYIIHVSLTDNHIPYTMSMKDIKTFFPEHSISTVIQCGKLKYVRNISCSSLTWSSVLMVPNFARKSSRSSNSSLCIKFKREYSSGMLFWIGVPVKGGGVELDSVVLGGEWQL
jgi:hypothetical protein